MAAFGLRKNTVEINQKETVIGEQIDTLVVSTSSADVEVETGAGEDIIILLTGEISEKLAEDYEFKVSQRGNSLDISFNKKKKDVGLQFKASYSDVKLQITLPEKTYNDLQIRTSSGEIILSKLVSKTVTSSSSSGSQLISDLSVSNKLFIKSSSGDIVVKGNNAGNAKLVASSGSIKSKELVSNEAIMETSSGDIVYNSYAINGNLDFKASSGNVDIQFDQVPETLSLECRANSGDVNVRIDDLEIKEKNDHNVVATLGLGKNNIKARTSSGDITIYTL
ncbi:DUF4097 family beta strand repeat-containing protein [Virgibacillus sp. DJP39]|uniref:DUF4097 family beta strand repeat-containing protein n=1 Tax=Virgibacillus sp. DJP39 TaxID=3409790 RepID=UPI003BB52AE8